MSRANRRGFRLRTKRTRGGRSLETQCSTEGAFRVERLESRLLLAALYWDPDRISTNNVIASGAGLGGIVKLLKLKRREFDELANFRGFGHMLISRRIARGLTQRELAKRLGVHESQVSRDERNGYFGITLERAMRVLAALHVRLRTAVEIEAPPREMAAV
jgi:plasmid maintenance system antidote protein VapI